MTAELTLRIDGPVSLLARSRKGDLDAFEQLIRAHERQVLAIALRMTGRLEEAQDIAQEAFLRLYRNLNKLQSEDQVRPWLSRVTVNLALDLRKGSVCVTALGDKDVAAATPDPEAAVLQWEREKLVAQALDTLPAKERAAIVLRDVEGLSTREVAGILGSSEATVRSQICVARMKLKKFTDRYLRKMS